MPKGEYQFWRIYKGIEYMHLEFTDLTAEEAIVRARDGRIETCKRPDTSVLALVVATRSNITPLALRDIRAEGLKTQSKFIRSAIVGSTGLTHLLTRLYIQFTGSQMKFFTDYEAAMEYLLGGTLDE